MIMKRKTLDSCLGKIELVELENESGHKVGLCSLGACITKVIVPDRYGKLEDIALGYENILDYIGDGPASGKIPGRFANRIARGRFSLDGKEYILPVNCGPNCLHGGEKGFHNQNWVLKEVGNDFAVFTYFSKDGECGFPGNLEVTAEYKWTDEDELKLTLSATSDATTVVNLTNHTYWNLSGHDSGTILNHCLKLAASSYLPTDSSLAPTGELKPVAGTPMDFRESKRLGKDIKEDFEALNFGKGYDACWAIDDYDGSIKVNAILTDEVSGRKLKVESDQPGVQVYTGNWLNGSPIGKGNHSYQDYEGVAIECQDFPDSPNQPSFPSTLLKPDEKYLRHINFKFFH